MATTSRHDSPKIAIVGTLVSDSAGAIPYVFRNYNFAANVTSSYRGSVRYAALNIYVLTYITDFVTWFLDKDTLPAKKMTYW